MNQLVTGKFIALKRKQKNLTQEQLAEKLGVSNKTISKWETGKCMPDYSIVKSLCEELEVTVAELMDGEISEENSVRTYDDEQILDLLRRTQELEKQKNMLYGIMLALFNIVQGTISTIMNAAGFGTPEQTTLPAEMVTTIEDCGFFESIPLWAVTLIGGLFITVLSFILIMTVYGRFFKLYMYTALAPIPLSTFAGEPTQNVGKSFIKSYCAVLLEGAVIVLACIIFSVFASSPPVVNPDAAAVTQVWAYIGELVFNMLVLVGAVKMSDRIIREMMGL